MKEKGFGFTKWKKGINMSWGKRFELQTRKKKKITIIFVLLSLEKLSQEIIGAKMDNAIKAQCMEDIVKQASLTTGQMIANLTKTNTDVQKIAADIQKMGYDVALKAESNEIAWKTLEQAYDKLLMEMDVKEEQMVKVLSIG
jgi:hypothetical protein